MRLVFIVERSWSLEKKKKQKKQKAGENDPIQSETTGFMFVGLSICPFICLSICLSVFCMFVCLFV